MAKAKPEFPGRAMRLFLLGYAMLMTVGLPFILAYFFWRGRHDRLYARHIDERLGRNKKDLQGCVWVHATSLGEVRSAVPLIDRMLGEKEKVVVTVHTPAGRREVLRVYGKKIEEGDLCVTYTPLEMASAWKGFFAAFRPKYGLVMEIEMWPRMIASAKRHGVPLFMCNAQYPARSFERDKKRYPLRLGLVQGYAGVLAKSKSQAARFGALGARQVEVTGELRFDQKIPKAQVEAGKKARSWLGAEEKMVVVFSSVVQGEEDAYIEVMAKLAKGLKAQGKPKPLFVFVPRAPERFVAVAGILSDAGHVVKKRLRLFDAKFDPQGGQEDLDVLLGDSFGEMNFYIAMADAVVVGGGFVAKGAHNIIEALSQGKPVFVGPETWTIEHPMEEALEAKVAVRVDTPSAMADALLGQAEEKADSAKIGDFCAEHGNAAQRTMDALHKMLAKAEANN